MLNTRKIADLESEIAKLKADDAEFTSMDPIMQLAVALHGVQCRYNHTDVCGWFYEVHTSDAGAKVHDWAGQTHKGYLKKADELAKCCAKYHIGIDTAITVIELTKGNNAYTSPQVPIYW